MWNNEMREAGATQREYMLTGLMWAAGSVVDTQYYLKLDTDTVAKTEGDLFDPQWIKRDIAYASHRWGYTKPAKFIRDCKRWADDVEELRMRPEVSVQLPESLKQRVYHPRIQSFYFLASTHYTRKVWEWCAKGQRLPCPSQDTTMWYCADRMKWPVVRVNMKRRGWSHGRNALKEQIAEQVR